MQNACKGICMDATWPFPFSQQVGPRFVEMLHHCACWNFKINVIIFNLTVAHFVTYKLVWFFFLQGSCTRKAQFLFTPLLFTGYYRPRVGKSPIVIPCSLRSISKLLHPFTIACFASFVILDCLIVNIFTLRSLRDGKTNHFLYDFHVNKMYVLCKVKVFF